ncbi:MAG: PspA/IM30 family protein [Gammaproteobacteria bacterium]
MALITRVSRLFQADFHAVLDRIEEPEVLLRQAVREMEEELARDEQCSKIMNHEQGQLTAREIDLEQSLHEIEEQLDVCFDTGNDDLARACVKRKLELQRCCKSLSRKRQALQKTLDDIDTRLRENRARLESMRQKAELLAEESARERPVDNWTLPDISVRDEDVEVAFLREKQHRRRS